MEFNHTYLSLKENAFSLVVYILYVKQMKQKFAKRVIIAVKLNWNCENSQWSCGAIRQNYDSANKCTSSIIKNEKSFYMFK